MLQELEIRDYALIDRLTINFSQGLNILTGETGAGKSIIIGAMGMMLGERTSADVIRTGAESTFVRGIFEVQDSVSINKVIDEAELKSEEDSNILILFRELSEAGRSKIKINDHTALSATLKEIGNRLIDIHGQHEHQTLFRQEEHLNILDSFGNLKQLRQKVAEYYNIIQDLQEEYKKLVKDRDEKMRQKDLLEFQLNELKETKLDEGEEEKLIRERQILNNSETIFELAGSIYDRLYNSEDPAIPAALDFLKSIKADLVKLHQIDDQLNETLSRFEGAIYELEDIASQMLDYRDRSEFDPQKLSEVESRLDLLYRLKRKYIVNSVGELIDYKNNVARELKELTLSSSRIDDLQNEIKQTIDKAKEVALKLSKERTHYTKILKSLVEKELHDLGMERTIFEVQVLQNEWEDGIIKHEGKSFKLSPDGIDSAEFLISPNVGEELRPLTKIASGGEISRIMLAIKTVLAFTDEVPVIIFDEIDAGIGGRIAEIIGRKLKELANSRQVICITHLPQIASLADSHCRVEKKVEDNRTVVNVTKLNDEERVKEIARMLAGEKITDVTVAHAREMIQQAKVS